MTNRRLCLVGLFSLLLVAAGIAQPAIDAPALYATHCAQCHGANLEGGTGSSLIDGVWDYGAKRHFKARNIKYGILSAGMPAWQHALDDGQIEALLVFILDRESTAAPVPPPLPTHVSTEDYELEVTPVVPGMGNPWAIEFIDARRALVTEVTGQLRWLIDDQLDPTPITGLPAVNTHVQGGLLDLVIDPDYAANGWIYICYTDFDTDDNVMIAIARGRVRDHRWIDEQSLFKAPADQYTGMNHNQGARVLIDEDGYLYFSIGDRGVSANGQLPSQAAAKVHRIHRDGTIPADNPFVGDPAALPSLYTMGNRNAQGLARHPATGELWETEHGPMGGDELNRLSPGANYGWPRVTLGVDYDGTSLSEHTSLPGLTDPIHHWTPSIAVCGIDFHDGTNFPAWRHNLFVTSLKFHQLRRLVVDEHGQVTHEEIMLKNIGRARDVDIAPDGSIYVLTNNPGRILKLSRSSGDDR